MSDIATRMAALGASGRVLYLVMGDIDGKANIRGFHADQSGERDVVDFTQDEVLGMCAMAAQVLLGHVEAI